MKACHAIGMNISFIGTSVLVAKGDDIFTV